MKSSRRKRRRLLERRLPPGTPPGSLIVDPQARPPAVRMIAYSHEEVIDKEVGDVRQIEPYLDRPGVVWVNVDGLGDAATIASLGRIFRLHPLALEDVVHVRQRAKVEDYQDHLYIVARMATLNETLSTEQVSIFLGRNFILSFLEDPGDCFDLVRGRIKVGQARIRSHDAGYLAYALLDTIIDSYFPIVETLGDRLDDREDVVIDRPEPETVAQIHAVKRELRQLRRIVWPSREAMASLHRDQSPFFDADTRVHLRDCYDHVVQLIDMVETYRELAADLTDLYLSSLSRKMNEVMKVLTIISTIFIPLSFVAGIYGMNFNTEISWWNMPELNWIFGYPFALGVMALVMGVMLFFFYRQGWLGAFRLPPLEKSEDAASGQTRVPNRPQANGEPEEVG